MMKLSVDELVKALAGLGLSGFTFRADEMGLVDIGAIDWDRAQWPDGGPTLTDNDINRGKALADARQPIDQAKAELEATDRDMARIAEEVITTLVDRGLMALTDFTPELRAKLERRRLLRELLQTA